MTRQEIINSGLRDVSVRKGMESSQARIARRMRASLLRQLACAPLSQWPQALVQCLDSLSASGVCHRSSLSEMVRPVVVDCHRGLEIVRAPAGGVPGSVASSIETEARPSPQVRQLCLYMRTHYGERISLGSLAAGVGRNAEYMATLFRRQTGTTIHRYLTGIRMQRAAKLLRRSEKVEAVMLLVGYRGKKNFYRQFETAFGVTPGQYKASHSRRRIRP